MTASYTPGPWSIERYGDGDTIVIHSNHVSRVCFMATPGSHGDPAKIKADAHLIVAAPDLLSACKAIVSAWEGKSGMGTLYEMPRALSLVRAAIAKAEQVSQQQRGEP